MSLQKPSNNPRKIVKHLFSTDPSTAHAVLTRLPAFEFLTISTNERGQIYVYLLEEQYPEADGDKNHTRSLTLLKLFAGDILPEAPAGYKYAHLISVSGTNGGWETVLHFFQLVSNGGGLTLASRLH